jgi:hypothetical protein
MSNDTTPIHQLPSQDITLSQPLNNNQTKQNGMYDNNMMPQGANMNNINMVVQENTMNRNTMNNEKRFTADEMTEKIRMMNSTNNSLGSTFSLQPSQIPQSTMPPQQINTMQNQMVSYQQLPNTTINTNTNTNANTNNMTNISAPQYTNHVQQNEMGLLLNSLNQVAGQQSNTTTLPMHQIQSNISNIDPMLQVNNIGDYNLRSALNQRSREPTMYNDKTDNTGNLQNRKSFYYTWFNELKVPLLICCLFFIFQMPFYRQNLHKNFKFLFQTDGNMNLYGYLSSSILFSVGYYVLNKLVR